MYVVKTPVRNREISNRRHRVPSDFGLLTWEAFSSPSGDVLIDGGPYDLRADRLARAFHARMSQAMDGVEDCFAEGERYERSGGSVTNVHDEAGAADVDLFEVKTRAGVVPDAAKIGIKGLMGGDGIPINTEGVDCVDDAVEVFSRGLSSRGCILRGRRAS